MRREIIALLPLVGLSAAFVVNQSCATKPALEEVEKEIDEPKKNIEDAKKNLKEAKGVLGEAKQLLEQAKQKLAKKEEEQVKTTEAPKEEVEEEQQPTGEFRVWKVGWCDTLWDISSKVYNNSLYWTAIYKLNRDKVGSDPWILAQGTVLKYKAVLSEEEKNEAVKEAIEWDLKYKDRVRSPKCPPK